MCIRLADSLCCTEETNTALCTIYTPIKKYVFKKHQTRRRRDQICCSQKWRGGGGVGGLDENGWNVQAPSSKINKHQGYKVQG